MSRLPASAGSDSGVATPPGSRHFRRALGLRRRLPPGRYVAYSRTRNAAGVYETSFSRRDGNRVAFRLRKRPQRR